MFQSLTETDVSTHAVIDDPLTQLEWENLQRSAAALLAQARAARGFSCVVQGCVECAAAETTDAEIEPLAEPATDEIPWSDLAFWLGSTSPDDSCGRQRDHLGGDEGPVGATTCSSRGRFTADSPTRSRSSRCPGSKGSMAIVQL